MNPEIKSGWPSPIATKDLLPTREDADKNRWFLVWCVDSWTKVHADVVHKFSHWLPQPPAPQSAEDVAFEAAWEAANVYPYGGDGQRAGAKEIFRAAWHARGAFERGVAK